MSKSPEVNFTEAQQQRAALQQAFAQLLTPATNPALKIEQVVLLQVQLNHELEDLTNKLNMVTLQSVSQNTAIDQYLGKLRQCRQRIDALNKLLATVKMRLTRVHTHLKAQTKATEKQNDAIAAELERAVANKDEENATDDTLQKAVEIKAPPAQVVPQERDGKAEEEQENEESSEAPQQVTETEDVPETE